MNKSEFFDLCVAKLLSRDSRNGQLMRTWSGAGCIAKVPDDVRFSDECVPEHTQDRPSGAQQRSLNLIQAADLDALLAKYRKETA